MSDKVAAALNRSQIIRKSTWDFCKLAEDNREPGEELIFLMPEHMGSSLRLALEGLGRIDFEKEPATLFGHPLVITDAVDGLYATYKRIVGLKYEKNNT